MLPITVVLCLLYHVLVSSSARSERSVCELAKEHCPPSTCDQLSLQTMSKIIEGRTGKAGPPGPPGSSSVIDYKEVDERIDLQLRGSKLYDRLERLERMVEYLQSTTESILSSSTSCELVCPKSCQDVKIGKAKTMVDGHGSFVIYPPFQKGGLEILCDLDTDGGKWTVFQRRINGSLDFARTWREYVDGFGENTAEFWLGLESIHQLTKDGEFELRIEITDWNDGMTYANYGTFRVGSSSTFYRLSVRDYSGGAGDSLSYSDGESFSSKDSDHDGYEDGNCAGGEEGGWWYKDCGFSKLNGKYYKGGTYDTRYSDGIIWYHLKNSFNYSLKKVEMKFRRKPQSG